MQKLPKTSQVYKRFHDSGTGLFSKYIFKWETSKWETSKFKEYIKGRNILDIIVNRPGQLKNQLCSC